MKDKAGDKQERTTWTRLEFFDRLAEIVNEYVKKGNKIAVVGKLNEDEWEDSDGNKRTATSVKVREMEMLGPKAEDIPF